MLRADRVVAAHVDLAAVLEGASEEGCEVAAEGTATFLVLTETPQDALRMADVNLAPGHVRALLLQGKSYASQHAC